MKPVQAGLFTLDDGGRLLGARCPGCGQWHFPAGRDCPYCAGEHCVTAALGGTGRLWLFTAVRTRPPGYEGEVPFGLGVVELAEGFRIIARLTEADPDRLQAGMAMRVVVVPLHVDGDGRQVVTYAFAPAENP
jgi:uncharacterized OB-fold protein